MTENLENFYEPEMDRSAASTRLLQVNTSPIVCDTIQIAWLPSQHVRTRHAHNTNPCSTIAATVKSSSASMFSRLWTQNLCSCFCYKNWEMIKWYECLLQKRLKKLVPYIKKRLQTYLLVKLKSWFTCKLIDFNALVLV